MGVPLKEEVLEKSISSGLQTTIPEPSGLLNPSSALKSATNCALSQFVAKIARTKTKYFIRFALIVLILQVSSFIEQNLAGGAPQRKIAKFRFIYCFAVAFILPSLGMLHAQDVHFTQFDASPLSLNPANTGNFTGFWRFSANFRSQWRILDYPFTSYSAGYERNLEDKGLPLSAGIYALHDEAGQAELAYDKIYLPVAIAVGAEKSKWTFGIQPGIISKSLQADPLTFPSQYNPNTGLHDPTLNSGEEIKAAKTFFDLNVGIAYRKIWNQTVFKIGLAGFHILRPDESLISSSARTPIRKVFHVSLAAPITESISLMPKVLIHEQGKASEFIAGNYFIAMLPPNQPNIQSVFMGVLGRFGVNRNLDAIMGVVGFNYERWDFGISYDINTSSLKSSTQGRGAIELSIIFWNGKVRTNRTTIICERF